MINYRTVQAEDIQKIVALWPQYFQETMTMEAFCRILFCDENYDPSAFLIAADVEQIAGFLIGIKRQIPYLERGLESGRAWILALGVLPEYRCQGIGTALLHQIVTYYQNNTKEIVLGAYSPLYFFPAVEEESQGMKFFANHGFQPGARAYGMHINLQNYRMPEDVIRRRQAFEAQGFVFRPFHSSDTPLFLPFIKREFSTGWQRNVTNAIYRGAAERTILLAEKDHQPAAYIQRQYDLDPNRFGPFGVSEKYRSQGLGTVMLHLCWQKMKEEGETSAYFKTTDDLAKKFYLRNGMVVDKVMRHMSGEVAACR